MTENQPMTEYRSGTGKVIRVDDMVTVSKSGTKAPWKVLKFRIENGEVYVDVYGGKVGRGGSHMSTRTFHIDRVSEIRKTDATDPHWKARDSLHEVARRSKAGKR